LEKRAPFTIAAPWLLDRLVEPGDDDDWRRNMTLV
jgi:hypothetical protein